MILSVGERHYDDILVGDSTGEIQLKGECNESKIPFPRDEMVEAGRIEEEEEEASTHQRRTQCMPLHLILVRMTLLRF